MKNQFIKIALMVLVLGSESTLGYLYSLIGPDHGGFLTQVEQDFVVKISFKLFGLVFSFCAARFALVKLKIWSRIWRARLLGVAVLSLFLFAGDAGTPAKKICENHVRKITLMTLI
ncbi:MAG: hypothetical protein ACRENG_09265 [bacterium]